MAWDLENGYTPRTFNEIKAAMLAEVNTQFGTDYDEDTIVGTNEYKYFYAGIQLVMQAEGYTAEITAKMTDYIRTANEKINLSKSTIDGFIAGLLDELELNSTIKNITSSVEAGYLLLCVDVDDEADDYETTKQEIIDRMHQWLSAGLYYSGSEAGTKTALNGQVFNYAYALPTPVDIIVRITVTASANAKTPILNENQIRAIFETNFAELYKLGLNFEPEKYLEIARDCPFASDILLEYSLDDGDNWDVEPFAMAYNEKINITAPATVSVV